ncbi:aminotransferase class I/II-fold pyridoxal phosphate-dependent enzyme [Endozoicomonas sp. Mp262]|uniref:threonine aldolase family protein n=1 Tax=Endozoicomonas sp. Mp262 TaxID=2919499 RepID=UPI0021E0CEC2
MIDLRSDTVTRPSEPMLKAMINAEVGDDVFGEDSTVKALEQKAAEMFGKEAALFCPSGTMTNQIAIMLHTRPGGEVICDQNAHIYQYEGGGIAVNALCSVNLQQGDRGRFTAQDVLNSIRADDVHFPKTQLVAVENTMNKGGGACYDFAELERIRKVCDDHNIPFHLDGARLFNAIVTKGKNPKAYGKLFDTISICLSKGLGAPVGSLLLGSFRHIKEARRIRKRIGGGMRQAGFLAAAGIYALDHNIERLTEDHGRAIKLSEALYEHPDFEGVVSPETNIVVAHLRNGCEPEQFLTMLKNNGIKAVHFGGQAIRFVTHLDFDDVQLEAFGKTISGIRG